MIRRSPALFFFPAMLLAIATGPESCGQGRSAEFELNRFRNQAQGAQFSSNFFVNQANNAGVAVGGGVGLGNIRPPRGNSAPSSFTSRRTTSPRTRAPSRPFSNINRRPSVSPYLNLFNASFDANADDLAYQTLVRPQLRQQRFNDRMRAEAAQINARLQSIAAQSGYTPSGNPNLLPTGTGGGVYRNYLHYYQFDR